ncbi:hypothetical protein [Paenibacillus sp. YIM B09110]|uniref:hypothetical protein n=1 Tax=unclassified Paenibacillus TaxID=185978 RepID=UPI00301C9C93
MGEYRFDWNERLRISLPILERDWEQYEVSEQMKIIEQWESIRGTIPDRVIEFERLINGKQAELFEEHDFDKCCELNYEIAEYASRINELHIWYRINQEMESRWHS